MKQSKIEDDLSVITAEELAHEAALELADGDPSRLQTNRDGTITVLNRSRKEDDAAVRRRRYMYNGH